MSEVFSVKDKVVLVSGGSRGIGRAIAEAFHVEGARVVASARNEIALKGTGLDYQVCDVAQAGQISACVDAIVRKYGRLDVLFNVAGINFRFNAENFPENQLDHILAVNVRGNYLMATACGRAMVRQGQGKIINIASLHTHLSLPGVSAYGTSKGAVGSMTRALAVEWAPHNVQVNAIAPGFIRTDLNAALWERKEIRTWVEQRTPAGRLGAPRDLVGTAIFLASAASDFLTGQVIYVDGGFTAGSSWPLEIPH
jgi:NAD(P)-dependent dehydrogenase (short-subunit alcohol dehydrogenase family)